MKLRTLTAAALALALATPAVAQRTISPGMTGDQVRVAFGAPATTRAAGEWAYWYYHNGCPNRCGSDDVVFFREGRVVAAVLRTAARRFSGPAASDALQPYDDASAQGGLVVEPPIDMGVRGNPRPRGERADGDERDEADADDRAPARVGGVRVDGAAPPARAGAEDQGTGRTTIIRGDDRGGSRLPANRPAEAPFTVERDAAATDTVANPALADDEERRAREGRVEPNTIRNQTQPDTIDQRRREREQSVTPRTVRPQNP